MNSRTFKKIKKLTLSTAAILTCSLAMMGFKIDSNENTYIRFRPHMQALYQSLTGVLGYALRDADSLSAKDLATIEQQLKGLSEQAKAVRVIASESDKGHELLARELEKNSELAYSKFKSGKRDQAKFYVSDVVNTCFGCHTSRSGGKDSQFTAKLSQDINLGEFDPLAKARFLSLSRQFEASEAEYEKILLSNKLNTDELINMDPVVEYLVLSLRVRDDSQRALKTLKSIESKPYPEVIKSDIKNWAAALSRHQNEKGKGTLLEQARKLIAEAKSSMEFPSDRSGMVQYILASKLLNAYLLQKDLTPSLKAETYYELGGCENIVGNRLIDEATAYFEDAIRTQPKSPLARRAFARYEENLLNGYSGSGGLHLPDDEKSKLEQLRKLAF